MVTVDPAGPILTGRSPGRATITASFGDLETSAVVQVRDQSGEMNVSFSRDVMSILTTKGCNGSACHGSPAGQNGFKLSLFGYDVAADHKMVVSEHGGRRVDSDSPENSLLLRKPSFQLVHGGGQLMTPESDAYRTLRSWLQQGAPLDSDGPRLERLEMYPRERILLGPGRRQPLVVVGRFSDGTSRDMTREVSYSVADEAVVAAPDTEGVVTANGRGLATVMARAVGKVTTSQIIVIDSSSGMDHVKAPENNFIDQHIFEKLRQVNIAPYPQASDPMFIRRVFLDAVGRLPAPSEVQEFLSDPRAGKRRRLIDNLLASRDYARHWLVKFEDWFRNSQYNSQGRTNASFKKWIRRMVAEDWPYDETVRQLLTSRGDTTVRPAGNFWHPAMDFMLRTFEPRKITPTVTRLFLGIRLDCAECHNHPLENLTQDDFYGMAAFFARLKVKHGYGEYRRIWYSERKGDLLHPVTKQPVAPRFLDGTIPAIPEGGDRREALADWITRTREMQFARATVNRIWAEYFGRGLVDPSDDFRSTNVPTHPALLDELARHFIESGFRFKELHRVILNSRTYQLSSRDSSRSGEPDSLTNVSFKDDNHLLRIIDKIVSQVGRRVDESSPMVDARLSDGSRVNAIIAPLSVDGPLLSIRRFGTDKLMPDDLVASLSITEGMMELLKGAVQSRLNILVSGGTGSGKTTMLNALSAFVSPKERVVTIEDAAELQLKQPHVVRLETRPPNLEGEGAVRQRELLINALRMRPDRIVIGECRGEEALDMLQAMNTGHDGSMTTVHANTPRDVISRLEVMITLGATSMPVTAIRNQIASALDLIVQVERLSDGTRRCRCITEVTTMEGDAVMLQDIFVFEKLGMSSDGRVLGRFAATGIRPRFYEKLLSAGIRLPGELFEESVDLPD